MNDSAMNESAKAIDAVYRLSPSDYMQGCAAYWSKTRQGNVANLAAGFAAIAVAAGAFVFTDFSLWLSALLFLPGIVLVAMVALRHVMWRRNFARSRPHAGDIHIRFYDQGIGVDMTGGSSNLEWDFYEAFLETEDFFILIIAPNNFSVIPKSAFSTDDQARLSALLAEKLQRR